MPRGHPPSSPYATGSAVYDERYAAPPRGPHRSPPGRVCGHPGCTTLLSRYNPDPYCFVHERFLRELAEVPDEAERLRRAEREARRVLRAERRPGRAYPNPRTGRPGPEGMRVTYGGETLSLRDWSERTGVRPKAIRTRLASGWPVERALFEPRRRPQAVDPPS